MSNLDDLKEVIEAVQKVKDFYMNCDGCCIEKDCVFCGYDHGYFCDLNDNRIVEWNIDNIREKFEWIKKESKKS